MKDMGPPLDLKPGDFVRLPANHVHQVTALTTLELYNVPDAAFDIHYVDSDGKEIPVGDALSAVHEAVAAGK